VCIIYNHSHILERDTFFLEKVALPLSGVCALFVQRDLVCVKRDLVCTRLPAPFASFRCVCARAVCVCARALSITPKH
jgi:hypothetical protein